MKGVTPLMNACVAGHFDTVQFLISEGANVNCQTTDNQTPLTLASLAGHIAIVALLLDYGANRNHKFEVSLHTDNNSYYKNDHLNVNLPFYNCLFSILLYIF